MMRGYSSVWVFVATASFIVAMFLLLLLLADLGIFNPFPIFD